MNYLNDKFIAKCINSIMHTFIKYHIEFTVSINDHYIAIESNDFFFRIDDSGQIYSSLICEYLTKTELNEFLYKQFESPIIYL